MVTVRSVGQVRNQLAVKFSDGSSLLCVPTGRGLWLPNGVQGVVQGAGGEAADPGVVSTTTPGSAAAPVDDYPWPNAPENDMSPLRYSYRDCTDFAAWRCNRDTGTTAAPWRWTWANLRIVNGNAIGWKDDWATHGWTVSTTPTAGMLGWYGSKAGTYGHVNYVQAVAVDGTVHLEEYNWGAAHQKYNQRDEVPGSAYYPDAFLGMPH
jgi:surface antigen